MSDLCGGSHDHDVTEARGMACFMLWNNVPKNHINNTRIARILGYSDGSGPSVARSRMRERLAFGRDETRERYWRVLIEAAKS